MPGKNDLSLLTYALLSGLTILVPIPFLDDWLRGQVQRRMVINVLKSQGFTAVAEEVELLIPAEESGCLRGCLLGGLFYVLKKLIRQIIPLLEWSRAMNTVSQTYYHGYLLDYALQHGRYSPGNPRQAARLQEAMRQAVSTTNTRFISKAIRQVLRRSHRTVVETSRWMGKEINRHVFRRGKAGFTGLLLWMAKPLPKRWQERLTRGIKLESMEEKLEEIIEKTPEHQRTAFNQLLNDLQQAIAGTSEQPLRLLEEKFEAALTTPTLNLAD
jgi:uncharacterized protein (DUF697 family)